MKIIEPCYIKRSNIIYHVTLRFCSPLLLRRFRCRLKCLLSLCQINTDSTKVILVAKGELLFLF